MNEGITSTNKLGTLPGNIHAHAYTVDTPVNIEGSSSGFSGRFTASVPKRRAHNRRVDSRQPEIGNVESYPDPYISVVGTIQRFVGI